MYCFFFELNNSDLVSLLKATMSGPIPVVTLGQSREIAEKIAGSISSKYNVVAVTDEVKNLKVILKSLRPAPQGLLIGGGYNDIEAASAMDICNSLGVTKFVRVTPGQVCLLNGDLVRVCFAC